MNNESQQDWLTIPVLLCISIEDTLTFWSMLGYTVTYKQTRPYQYGVVSRNGNSLHFAYVKGTTPDNHYHGSLVMVRDIDAVYLEFIKSIKQQYGKVLHTGIPRISRKKEGTTRFTLTDVGGNSVIFIQYGEEDQSTWEKADLPHDTSLEKSISLALRFRDYKEDLPAAFSVLEVAYKKAQNESPSKIGEAVYLLIDLAEKLDKSDRAEIFKDQWDHLKITKKQRDQIIMKHKDVV